LIFTDWLMKAIVLSRKGKKNECFLRSFFKKTWRYN
jgi:hypothetical protein